MPSVLLTGDGYSGGNWIDRIQGLECTLGDETFFSSENGISYFKFDYSRESMITCPYDLSPSVNSELTLEIIFKLDEDYDPDATLGWIIGHDTGGYDRGIFLSDERYGGVGQGVGFAYTTGISTPSNGEWHHAIATFNQNVAGASFVCVDNECGTPTTANNNEGYPEFTIGGQAQYATNHGVKGAVASVRIYEHAFDRDMAADAYNAHFKVSSYVVF